MNLLKKFKSFFYSLQNCELATLRACNELNVPVTTSWITKRLREHPDYPSLLSVRDIMNELRIDNLAFSIPIEKLRQLGGPSIVQLKEKGQFKFAVLESISQKTVNYYHPEKDKIIHKNYINFASKFTGVVMILEASATSSEKDYLLHNRQEKKELNRQLVGIFTIPVFTMIMCILTFIYNSTDSLPAIMLTLLTLLGCIISSLLLWMEIDQSNPILQQICTSGTRSDCNAVINSKGAKILGTSWSVIGITYFAGNFLSLLVLGIYNKESLFFLSWINVISLPYIIFSIYYQTAIAKQWCPLCLAVQVILALQFAISCWAGYHHYPVQQHIDFSVPIGIFMLYVFILSTVIALLPTLKKGNNAELYRTELMRLKMEPQIFSSLLTKEKAVTTISDLGITLGRADAKNKIIKVSNPYCEPCARSYSEIEQLLENNLNLNVQIIYTATSRNQDVGSLPIRHFLAIADQFSEEHLKLALSYWFKSKKKDYKEFARKYPVDNDLTLYDQKIDAMSRWCNQENITFTPAFFINGHPLPKMYNIKELKYIFAS